MSELKLLIKKPLIRHPKTKKRLEVGKTIVVPASGFWLKRLRDGDVEKVELKVVEPKQPKPKQKMSSAKIDDKKHDEVSK